MKEDLIRAGGRLGAMVTGYRALHESAGVSFGARSRKKLTGKSSWFKTTKKQLDETEKAEGTESIPTAPTIQEHRRE